MIYGYIRISKDSSNIENQRHQILQYCKTQLNTDSIEWFEDVISGQAKATDRKLGKLIEKMKYDDLLIIASTSRFGRNFFDVMLTGSLLYEKGAALYAIQQNFDFSPKNPLAKLLMSVYAWMDEAEREAISERTKASLSRLKDNGVVLGRPNGSTTSKLAENEKEVLKYNDMGLSFTAIAKIYNVSRQTVANFIAAKAETETVNI
jgi:DNA invertase Pin-like site-specific DNA recombinase